MIKTIELILAIFLMFFCFFAGVKYSDSIKSHASWLFESKEEEVELPDLSGEGDIEITSPSEGASSDQGNPAQQPSQEQGSVATDSIESQSVESKPTQAK